jgi:glycosyltransferase involved in cell wall biosynthesis
MDHFILGLTRSFQRRGWEVRFAFGADLPAEFQTALTEAGGGAVTIPFPFTRQSARELIAKLNGYQPDVTQTSFLSAFTSELVDLKRKGFTRRLVVIDHSSGESPLRRGWKRLAAKLRGWWVGRMVDAIVPVSQAIARRDIERVFLPAHKVRVVHNGIQVHLFPNPPRPTRIVTRVVYAGQLIPEKGVMTLLQAHDRLRKAGVKNYELVIAGQGHQEAELKAFCAAAGREDVQFLGHSDSIPALFGSADVVVVPSIWYEAFGLVLAEAMACGAACLVSDAGALPEVVGEAGRVFRAGDENDLAKRLKELLDDPATCQRLGQAGRVRAETHFTLERMVEEHVAVCEAVLSPAP